MIIIDDIIVVNFGAFSIGFWESGKVENQDSSGIVPSCIPKYFGVIAVFDFDSGNISEGKRIFDYDIFRLAHIDSGIFGVRGDAFID